jgi:hypothetical protein
VFFGDTCSFEADPQGPHTLKPVNVGRNKTVTISADEIAAWKDRVDPDGFFYLRGNLTNAAYNLSITSTAPEETDPTYPSATIAVACIEGSSDMTVRVSENQTIVIKDIAGSIIKQWDAEAGEAYTVTLPAGAYTLSGEAETIALKVP